METPEVVGFIICLLALIATTIVSAILVVKFQDQLRVVQFILFGVWILVCDITGQGMIFMSGALKGEPKSEALLGFHYLTGSMPGAFRAWNLPWPKNPERGKFWLEKATASNSPEAQEILAEAYANGDKGLDKNPAEACVWLTKIVGNKDSSPETRTKAAFMLFNYYRTTEEGTGVEPDPKKAFTYCSIAADGGNAEASWQLGKMYEAGDIVPQNYGKAYVCYQTAVKNGCDAATEDLMRLKEALGQK